ncbi:MAG: ribosome small subunit-dependent GTPase A [Candidatus Cloacimonetes bacterium]|nr:ribosome small subunit-dependent GTPase A [Candidatus Cloacimonadota bacterium]
MKKKDRKKFKRQDISISNADISGIDDFIDEEVIHEKKADKKLLKKGLKSQKSDLKLLSGRVVEIYSNYKCLVESENTRLICPVSGRLKHLQHNTRNIVAVGDWVKIDTSVENRIEEICERKNTLVRYTEDSFQKGILIAANIDNVIIMTSYHNPELNFGLVDRLICAARLDDIVPVICINKIDLAESIAEIEKEAEFYRQTGIEIVLCSALDGRGKAELKAILKDKDTVFVGHSGVGKSSLINQLQPGLNLKVSSTSEVTGKGMHTTTRSKIFSWEFGGNMIDTPGIKTLTLHEESRNEIKYVFPGMAEMGDKCQFQNCTHTHEKDCAVKNAVENGEYDQERYNSYLRIMDSFTGVIYE